jgi:hypothetical protein
MSFAVGEIRHKSIINAINGICNEHVMRQKQGSECGRIDLRDRSISAITPIVGENEDQDKGR